MMTPAVPGRRPRYLRVMRAVFDALECLGVRYFVTGSVAASVHGVLRQSQDTDIVLDIDASRFGELTEALGERCVVADPIDFGSFSVASIVEQATADKVDVILAPTGRFEASAMERRRLADVPGVGPVWVASVEDLLLAKLVWSAGTSELQLRDCAQLIRLNVATIDRSYLESWAERLGVRELLREIDR